jgi:hypothetical protein
MERDDSEAGEAAVQVQELCRSLKTRAYGIDKYLESGWDSKSY